MKKDGKISRRYFGLSLGAAFLTSACEAPSRQPIHIQNSGYYGRSQRSNVKVVNASYTGDTQYTQRSFQSARARPRTNYNPSFEKVTAIYVKKSSRTMYLMNGRDVLKSYNIDLGFQPNGTKVVQGDGKTPEGTYYVDRKNPHSQFYLSIGISYPNARDRARAASLGRSPGGDIFIHGDPNGRGARNGDWTNGCIAVSDREMDELWEMIPIGTPIKISA